VTEHDDEGLLRWAWRTTREAWLWEMFRTHRVEHIPWLTMLLAGTLLVTNSEVAFGGPPGAMHDAFACRYALVDDGEWWRIFLFWLPHLNPAHLWPDVIYLGVMGWLIERNIGRTFFVATFLGANFFGGLLSYAFDEHWQSVCGSSDGTHALLVALSVLLIARGNFSDFCWGVGSILWIAYHTALGLKTGYMGWPFDEMPNGGWDHVGGLLFGLAAGGVALLLERRHHLAFDPPP
jgi:membrane associated rhomboid family serine protease